MNNVVRIIFSYIVNYPVLKFWEQEIAKPIGLVFENRTVLAEALKMLMHICILIEPDNSYKEIKKVLRCANSHGTVSIVSLNLYERTRKRKMLEILLDANAYGYCDGETVSTAVVLLFDGVVPNKLKKYVYEIHLTEKDLNCDSFQLKDIVPNPKELALIKDKICQHTFKTHNSIIPAATFLYTSCSGEKYLECIETASVIDSRAEEFACQDGVAEFFCEKLYEFVGDGEIDAVYRLPYINEEGVKSLENALFFDEMYVYLHSKYFQKLCMKFFDDEMSNVIVKSALLECGIIIADGTCGYTTKMSYIKATGKFERVRMIKFDTKRIQGDTRESIINYLQEVM